MHTTKRFLLLMSCAWCIAFAQNARADYTGLEVIERTDLTICQDTTESYIPYKMDVCEVHVVLDDPADRLISVALTNVSTTAQQGFFQHTLGSNTAPACGMIPLFPTLECDSFITLGLECDRGGSTTDPDFDSTGFNTSGEVSGGWYNSAPSNGQGAPDANNRVMIGRFSYKQNKNTSGDVCVFIKLAGSADITSFLLEPFDCSVPGLQEGTGSAGDPPPAACVDGTGSCFEDNGTVGCDCGPCCELVCSIDPDCCTVGWDEQCAGQACDPDQGCDIFGCQDCNNNGRDDVEDIACGGGNDCGETAGSFDCNTNGIPDECEIDQAEGDPGEFFCTPGACIADCDACFPAQGCEQECVVTCDLDCNSNGTPDECEPDCNENGIPDDCDISSGFSMDVDKNGIPDECEEDCNYNGVVDSFDISSGCSEDCSEDCNENGIPDECDVAVRGPMLLSGHDADFGNDHCWNSPNACGDLYGALLTYAVENSRTSPGQARILAIGVNDAPGSDAFRALEWFNDTDNAGPGAELVVITTPAEIAAEDFNLYSAIYVPSSGVPGLTEGGITQVQLDALNARQADIVEYVDFRGGGVVALTEAELLNPYAWLPVAIGSQDQEHFFADPTEFLAEIPGHTADTRDDLSPGGPYHNIFTGPPGFHGLRVLAVTTDSEPPAGLALLLGELDFPSEFDCDRDGIPDTCQCRSDFSDDGTVGAFDLAILLGCWGPLPIGGGQCNCRIDADGDGDIGPFDLAFLLGDWGPCCGDGLCYDVGESPTNPKTWESCNSEQFEFICEEDCGECCGDGTCDLAELCNSTEFEFICEDDCLVVCCGNGDCDPAEECGEPFECELDCEACP